MFSCARFAFASVTDAVDSLDDSGVFGIDLNSLAKLADRLVDGSAVGDSVLPPAFLEERLAMHHVAVGIMQQNQER